MKLKLESNRLLVQYHQTRTVEIRNKLVMLHQGLVYRVASKYKRSMTTFEDLTQIGTFGLIKAIDRFDPTRPKAFVKYAKQSIEGEILHYFRDRKNQIKPPRSLYELYFRGLKVEACDSEIPAFKIAQSLNISVAKWLEAQNACKSPISLDKAVYDGATNMVSILDTIEDPASQNMWSKVKLNLMLDRFSAKRRRILELRYLEDKTQKDVANSLGISISTVEKHLKGAISQLRSEQCRG